MQNLRDKGKGRTDLLEPGGTCLEKISPPPPVHFALFHLSQVCISRMPRQRCNVHGTTILGPRIDLAHDVTLGSVPVVSKRHGMPCLWVSYVRKLDQAKCSNKYDFSCNLMYSYCAKHIAAPCSSLLHVIDASVHQSKKTFGDSFKRMGSSVEEKRQVRGT